MAGQAEEHEAQDGEKFHGWLSSFVEHEASLGSEP